LAVISLALVAFLSYFPYPARGNFSLVGLLKERAASLGEAAAKSRWQLLPPLLTEIKKHWLLGAGFGSTITYRSFDPRVLASSPTGLYTTSAFEWGWLDTWLKLGLVGLLIYLALIYKILKRGWWRLKVERRAPYLSLGLNFTLIALVIINFFTPYLNHPLGLGWLMLVAAIFEYQTKLEPIKSL
jgi:O-antigen ligase